MLYRSKTSYHAVIIDKDQILCIDALERLIAKAELTNPSIKIILIHAASFSLFMAPILENIKLKIIREPYSID